MGTRLDALLFCDGGGEGSNCNDGESLKRLWGKAEAEMRRIEKMLNRFDDASEISRLNASAQRKSAAVSEEMWQVMLDCRRYYELTGGKFDVTLGRFGTGELLEESHSIRFDYDGTSLDFGGYGKGYALKLFRELLTGEGIRRAFINFGNSSTLAIGSHPYGDSWQTGIEDPANYGVTLVTVSLCNSSLSVSGNSPARPQHIYDPSLGMPVRGDILVAVEAEDPLDAEVLSTAWVASSFEEETAGDCFVPRNDYRKGRNDDRKGRNDGVLPDWFEQFKIKQTYKLK
jgi:thiamine biosynthesis lipoprotein